MGVYLCVYTNRIKIIYKHDIFERLRINVKNQKAKSMEKCHWGFFFKFRCIAMKIHSKAYFVEKKKILHFYSWWFILVSSSFLFSPYYNFFFTTFMTESAGVSVSYIPESVTKSIVICINRKLLFIWDNKKIL